MSLEPDLEYIERMMGSLRKPSVVYGGDEHRLLMAELTILNVSTQREHIEVLKLSIISQDNLARTQKILGYIAMILSAVQVMTVFVFARIGG